MSTGRLGMIGACLPVLLPALTAGALAAADFTAPRQPVYVYLVSHDTDHVNIEMTEDRLRRMLPVVERIRKAHPEYRPSVTCLFTGAASEVLAERNDKTHIKDLVEDYVAKGLVEPGYDGNDEPTFHRRPEPDFSNATTPESRWLARADAAAKFLTEYRDPLTGVPKAGAVGGLQLMQKVFGPAAFLDGVSADLGSDTETIYHLGGYNKDGILMGILDPSIRPRGIPGFRVSATTVGKIVTTTPDDSSELSWQDNYLRLAQTSDSSLRVVMGFDGPDAVQGVLGKLNRDRVRIIQVELADERMYLQPSHAKGVLYPPLSLAYNYPKTPALPAEAIRPAMEIDAAHAKEEALLDWLVNTYFPANPGCRFISNREIRQRVDPSLAFSVTSADLVNGAATFLKEWEPLNRPPDYLKAGSHYLSLADTFLLLANELAAKHTTGKLPESLQLTRVYGPVEMDIDHGPKEGTVSVAAVMTVCADLIRMLNDQGDQISGRMPRNMIPTWVAVGGLRVNAAQFLRLMAQSLLAPSRETQLAIKMSYMFSNAAVMFPKTRNREEQGGSWTFKPAPLKTAPAPSHG